MTPLLPEVEVLRRDLEREVVGRRVKEAEVRPGSNAMKIIRHHGRRKDFQELLTGARIDRAGRKGTHLVLELDNGHALVIYPGPAGQLLKTSASDGLGPHTHVVIGFTIGGQLRYIDPQKSGEIYVLPLDEVKTVGCNGAIDPFESPLTWQRFSLLLSQRDQPLKDLLMDESFVCGLGDIYSDEILWAAGLRHGHLSNKLSSQDVRRLYRGLSETLQEALKARGTTSPGSHSWVDLQGIPGSYQLELKVYGRADKPCRRCRHLVVREKIDRVYAYFCPQCQA
ncbi:MAG: hypothetical protein H0T12_02510 [Actinobacteria bacterium]|nr:hypothetical protein [Actinomycetota bacterium]